MTEDNDELDAGLLALARALGRYQAIRDIRAAWDDRGGTEMDADDQHRSNHAVSPVDGI